MTPEEKAGNFLEISKQFRLGSLNTEQSNPLTRQLSTMAQKNMIDGLQAIKSTDVKMLGYLSRNVDTFVKLKRAIYQTLDEGGRIFIGGCGATGRLALSIETIIRKERGEQDVISFMAGGDYALVKSIEQFEDRMSYGAKQLQDLNFNDNDLFVGCSEGGETPFVIGATLNAASISKRSPFFLYCNPDEQLMHLERCVDLMAYKKIERICLDIGPQALSGSTRMQASTAIMFVLGMCILHQEIDENDFKKICKKKLVYLENLDYLALKPFITKESETYKAQGSVTYLTDSDYAIAVLTDTTERSPTFSLAPFEADKDTHQSLCYLSIRDEKESQSAWMSLLERVPRGLDWESLETNLSLTSIFDFDISENAITRRNEQCAINAIFDIQKLDGEIAFKFGECEHKWDSYDQDLLTQHLSLKLLLNTHSTLVMGAIGRYSSNIMTHLKTSNNKLIDRAARYVELLLKQEDRKVPYHRIIMEIFRYKDSLREDESIVLKVYDVLKKA